MDTLQPEIYQYQFEADGIATIDPANPWIAAGLRPSRSMVEVPATPPAFWEAQDVPHGVVSMHTFQSMALGKARTFRVYTPPTYDQQPAERFPVLYLLHGSGDMDDGWTIIGRAHLIEDNLLAAGQAKPMLIVMPDGGYPRAPGHENDFETDFFEAIIPVVEAHYRVAPGAANHAMAGLSMGGFQTLNVGMKHQNDIAWLGVFSAGIRDGYAETHGEYVKHANEKLSLLWIGIGEDDFLLAGEKKLEALLTENGAKYEAHLSKGGHTWNNWRHYLADFLPKLFRTPNP
jgi:enterochelin esterase family protein